MTSLRQRLLAAFRAMWREYLERERPAPRIRVDRKPELDFDERSSMDRFRRESGQR